MQSRSNFQVSVCTPFCIGHALVRSNPCCNYVDNSASHVILHVVCSEAESGAVLTCNYQSSWNFVVPSFIPCSIGCALFCSNHFCCYADNEVYRVVLQFRWATVSKLCQRPTTNVARTHYWLLWVNVGLAYRWEGTRVPVHQQRRQRQGLILKLRQQKALLKSPVGRWESTPTTSFTIYQPIDTIYV